MPHKPRPNKRTKRSIAARKLIKLKESESRSQNPESNGPEEGSSEQIFERLLIDSRLESTNISDGFQDQDNQSHYSSDSDKSSDYLPPLLVEKCHDVEDYSIIGRRIVNVSHVLMQLEKLASHPNVCTMGRYKFEREVVSGFYSKWEYYCDNCEKRIVVTSEPEESKEAPNNALVWGALSVGLGYAQVEELFTIMDVTVMGRPKFKSHEKKIGEVWEDTLYTKMKANAEEEKRIALEKGNILNGTPFITVIGDGGWAKRSYGHGMTSTGGVGVIIGAETKKLLYLEVRNKFCYVCTRSKNKGVESPEHDCYLNYSGPSTGMEANIIVNGFKRSEEDYGLIYRYYIGDGDSSVFARIQESCSYGRFVQKVECANHVTRALNDQLHRIAGNTKYPIASRKLLLTPNEGEVVPRLERITKGVRTAIKEAASGASDSKDKVANLRHDLKNSVDHVFGKHDRCRDTFCTRKGSDVSLIDVVDKDFLLEIRKVLANIECKAESLVLNKTTNLAEQYMSLVAKFTGGKRVNYCSRGSYRRRCVGAGLSHTSGPGWHFNPWKKLNRKSPGTVFKLKVNTRVQLKCKRALAFSKNGPPKKKKRYGGSYDSEYGPLCIEPDMKPEELNEKMEEHMRVLSNNAENGQDLERKTVGQHNNQLWRETRVNMLTASNFGSVVKRREHTPCHNLVKRLLYSRELSTAAVLFGRVHEKTAIEDYEKLTGVSVEPCGLFIAKETPFLGASPDGLVGNEGIVEVKCLSSVKGDLTEFVSVKKNKTCMELNKEGKLMLKKTHNYYFQVQGQLNIAERSWCDFIIFTRTNKLFVERITIDNELWTKTMLPKLARFYKNCILPEIVDSRINRQLRVRDPAYIIDAQSRKEKANLATSPKKRKKEEKLENK